jgi:Holliday junction resolvasome RuvABC endonuclease subunit
MDCSGLVIFDIETFEPVLITSIPTNSRKSHGERLYMIAKRIKEITKEYPPSVIAIERGFSRFNTSTQVIYRVHGIVNCMFWDLPQWYYPPKTVKEAILNGSATKKAIQNRILQEYPDIQFANEDESDAFAVGLTALIREYGMPWNKLKKTRRKKDKQ